MREIILYSIRSETLSQWRDFRIGVMCLSFGAWTIVRKWINRWPAVMSQDLVNQSVRCSVPRKGKWLNSGQNWKPRHSLSFQSLCWSDCARDQLHHGLYGSKSCCTSNGLSQWEIAIFDPTAPRPINLFLWNFKYINTSRTWPCMQNFSGLHRRGWSGK